MDVMVVNIIACSFIKKKTRYRLRVKQYNLAHLVCVVGTPKSDKAEAKTSSEGFFLFLFARSRKALQGAMKVSSKCLELFCKFFCLFNCC